MIIKHIKNFLILLMSIFLPLIISSTAYTANLTMLCYNNSTECDTFKELAKGWTAETGHTIDIEVVAPT